VTKWVFNRVLVPAVSYDANVIVNGGELYFIYNKQFGPSTPASWPASYNAILAHRMKDPAHLDNSSSPRVLLSPGDWVSEFRDGPGSMKIVESVHLHKLRECWAFIYSVGDFDEANYAVGVAYSKAMFGPFERVVGADPKGVWPGDEVTNHTEVAYALQTEHHGWPNYAADFLNGPGIGNIVEFGNGSAIMVFHARREGKVKLGGNGRYVWTVPVEIDQLRGRLIPKLPV
jgi:hypothetical protein